MSNFFGQIVEISVLSDQLLSFFGNNFAIISHFGTFLPSQPNLNFNIFFIIIWNRLIITSRYISFWKIESNAS